MTISDQRVAAFLADIKVTKSVTMSAHNVGVSPVTAYKIARKNNIETERAAYKTDNNVLVLLYKISGKKSISQAAKLLKLKQGVLSAFCRNPERLSLQFSQGIITTLSAQFPDKAEAIARLETLICFPRQSAAKLKKFSKEIVHEFRQLGGSILHDWREACGLELDEVRRQITLPALKSTLPRIETSDQTLALSVYRDALRILPDIYARHDPATALAYIAKLEKLVDPH